MNWLRNLITFFKSPLGSVILSCMPLFIKWVVKKTPFKWDDETLAWVIKKLDEYELMFGEIGIELKDKIIDAFTKALTKKKK